MAGVLGNKNAVGCGAKLIGNTNRLIHGLFSRDYLQKRAERNQFMRECKIFIEQIEEIIKYSGIK